jgi:hypothetical protein
MCAIPTVCPPRGEERKENATHWRACCVYSGMYECVLLYRSGSVVGTPPLWVCGSAHNELLIGRSSVGIAMSSYRTPCMNVSTTCGIVFWPLLPAMATEQVQVALAGKPSCEESNFGPLPDFPQRLRAAGIDEEDFKMVFQICADNERAKLKCIAISFPVIAVTWPFLICYLGAVVNPEAGAWEFNKKYKEKNIKLSYIKQSYSFVFTVPAEVAATIVPAQIVREDDDQVAKLEKLQTMLEKGLVTQEEHDAKKAEILANL